MLQSRLGAPASAGRQRRERCLGIPFPITPSFLGRSVRNGGQLLTPLSSLTLTDRDFRHNLPWPKTKTTSNTLS
jgi:hypothetical protein